MSEALRLEALRAPAAPERGARFAARVEDRKTQQVVIVTGDEPSTAYTLDDDARRWWAEGQKHTDAVLVADWEVLRAWSSSSSPAR